MLQQRQFCVEVIDLKRLNTTSAEEICLIGHPEALWALVVEETFVRCNCEGTIVRAYQLTQGLPVPQGDLTVGNVQDIAHNKVCEGTPAEEHFPSGSNNI